MTIEYIGPNKIYVLIEVANNDEYGHCWDNFQIIHTSFDKELLERIKKDLESKLDNQTYIEYWLQEHSIL